MTFESARAARRALDAKFASVDLNVMRPTTDGWIRPIRTALGMSAAELGARMGISRQAVAGLEASEGAGTVRLESLQRAAAAMDCRLVYALVPRTTLQETVEAAAGRIVDIEHAAVTQTMALEGQAVGVRPTDRADAIDDVIRSARIWSFRSGARQ